MYQEIDLCLLVNLNKQNCNKLEINSTLKVELNKHIILNTENRQVRYEKKCDNMVSRRVQVIDFFPKREHMRLRDTLNIEKE